ncbi:MAG: LysR family transcriptional regulator [Burkholderiales bacterium]|nr:LysR family transcriptional regulator [Burkholderiales bacterium]
MTAASDTVQARFRLRLTRGGEIVLGPGKVDLLEAIVRTGSITAAAKALGMSYRRAWLLVDTMNRTIRAPVVTAGAGGARGGGATLTPLGEEVVVRYRRIEAAAARAAAADLRWVKALAGSPGEST